MDSTVFTDVPKACWERTTRWCGSIRMRITCASYATKTAPKGKGIVLLKLSIKSNNVRDKKHFASAVTVPSVCVVFQLLVSWWGQLPDPVNTG